VQDLEDFPAYVQTPSAWEMSGTCVHQVTCELHQQEKQPVHGQAKPQMSKRL
jgi:hypothetical protein